MGENRINSLFNVHEKYKKVNIINSYRFGDGGGGVIPISNIISYYKFQNNVTDSQGLNDGTASSLTYASGQVGQSGVFNGTSSWVDLGNDSSLDFLPSDKFTFGFITRSSNWTSGDHFFARESTSSIDRRMRARYITDEIDIWFLNPAGIALRAIFPFIPLDNTWYDINITYNNDVVKLYINSIEIPPTSLTGAWVTVGPTTTKTFIGGENRSFASPFTGNIDEFRIFNIDINQNQATAIYNKLLSGQSLI